MKLTTSSLKSALLLAIPIALSLAASRDANAQVGVSVGIGVSAPAVVIEPPAAYIETVSPEYFEGRPVYLYQDHWYYRDHGRWSYYHHEPGYLHERRAHWVDRGHARGGYVRGGNAHPGGYVRGPGYAHPGGARVEPARSHTHR